MFITFVIFLYIYTVASLFYTFHLLWFFGLIFYELFFFCVFYRFHVEIMTALNLLST